MEGFIFDAENASSSWYQSGLHYSGVYGTPCADKVLEVAPQVLPPSTRSLCELIAILILCAPFALTYLITSYGSQNAVAPGNASRQPPMVPYCVPLLGNVLHYLWDTADLASSIIRQFGASSIVRLHFLAKDIYVVSGADNLNIVWKCTKELTSTNGICIALSNMFDTPKKDMEFFKADNSGISHDPHSNSTTQPKDRIFYLMHKATVDCLAGAHLVSSAASFQNALRKQIDEVAIGDEWVDMPDLYAFLRPLISHSTVEAMCGPNFLSMFPGFVDDFWNFNSSMPKLLQGWPRWIMPRAWQARDKCIETMKSWRKMSTERNFSGNAMIPQRWSYFSKMEGLSEHGVACSDLGILWGMNSNSMPATFWLFWYMLRDPQLLSRCLDEANASATPHSSQHLDFDTSKLCNQPLLQSSYAETLRLRVAVYLIRKPEYQDVQIGRYTIPKDKMILISSHTAHMDKRNWNLGGDEEEHPVERFWSERFLTYGKELQPISTDIKNVGAVPQVAPSRPRFSLSGYSGAWIPFGGGIHQCPGRHWVKLQMLLSFAMVCSAFEIELSAGGRDPQVDMKKYGLGALQPKLATPFRIRRKRT